MSRPSTYQPAIHPHLIKALYHEAKFKGVPMTTLLREIVTDALEGSVGERKAREELREATGEAVAA